MMNVERVIRSLIAHEGYKKFPYVDTVGKITIGIGYNLSDRGLSDVWIDNQCKEDIKFFYEKLSEFPWFLPLSEERKIVLIDMAFMGWAHFKEFKKLFCALEDKDYARAAREILNSKWAKQVGQRAEQLADAMRSGEYNI